MLTTEIPSNLGPFSVNDLPKVVHGENSGAWALVVCGSKALLVFTQPCPGPNENP